MSDWFTYIALISNHDTPDRLNRISERRGLEEMQNNGARLDGNTVAAWSWAFLQHDLPAV